MRLLVVAFALNVVGAVSGYLTDSPIPWWLNVAVACLVLGIASERKTSRP